MWHVLRAELAYSRSYLLGGLGLAAGVVALVSVVFWAVGDEGPPSHAAAGIRGMFLIMAPVGTGFVIQALRVEERRSRLLLAGPLTPVQLAGATVLLPVVLFGMGVVAAATGVTVEALATGRLAVESLHIVGYVGGLILMMQLIGLLAQEATAAHRQGRRRAAVGGWAGFVAALLFLAVVTAVAVIYQGPLTWFGMHVGNLIAAIVGVVGTVAVYAGRTDFTR